MTASGQGHFVLTRRCGNERHGQVAEWSIAPVLKTGGRASDPGVFESSLPAMTFRDSNGRRHRA